LFVFDEIKKNVGHMGEVTNEYKHLKRGNIFRDVSANGRIILNLSL
jgi:hypothetical protein